MIKNLLWGIPVIAICLALQILLIVWATRYYTRRRPTGDLATMRHLFFVMSGVTVILVCGIMLQVSIWALLFIILGEFSSFETAVYHSAVNFATLGYGDLVMSDTNKLLGPLQAINGVLMIGLATAALTATIQDAFKDLLGRQLFPSDKS